jgi:hypothetical protein
MIYETHTSHLAHETNPLELSPLSCLVALSPEAEKTSKETFVFFSHGRMKDEDAHNHAGGHACQKSRVVNSLVRCIHKITVQ